MRDGVADAAILSLDRRRSVKAEMSVLGGRSVTQWGQGRAGVGAWVTALHDDPRDHPAQWQRMRQSRHRRLAYRRGIQRTVFGRGIQSNIASSRVSMGHRRDECLNVRYHPRGCTRDAHPLAAG